MQPAYALQLSLEYIGMTSELPRELAEHDVLSIDNVCKAAMCRVAYLFHVLGVVFGGTGTSAE